MEPSKPLKIGTANKRMWRSWSSPFLNGRTARKQKEERDDVSSNGRFRCERVDDENATPHPTGFWSEEFVTPHRTFTDAGLTVTVASPGGVTPTVDPLSFNLSYNNNDAGKSPSRRTICSAWAPR